MKRTLDRADPNINKESVKFLSFRSVSVSLASDDTISVVEMGISIMGVMTVAPKAAFSEPIALARSPTSILAKLYSRAKNAINSVAISAKVVIHAGANFLHGGQVVFLFCCSSSATS